MHSTAREFELRQTGDRGHRAEILRPRPTRSKKDRNPWRTIMYTGTMGDHRDFKTLSCPRCWPAARHYFDRQIDRERRRPRTGTWTSARPDEVSRARQGIRTNKSPFARVIPGGPVPFRALVRALSRLLCADPLPDPTKHRTTMTVGVRSQMDRRKNSGGGTHPAPGKRAGARAKIFAILMTKPTPSPRKKSLVVKTGQTPAADKD